MSINKTPTWSGYVFHSDVSWHHFWLVGWTLSRWDLRFCCTEVAMVSVFKTFSPIHWSVLREYFWVLGSVMWNPLLGPYPDCGPPVDLLFLILEFIFRPWVRTSSDHEGQGSAIHRNECEVQIYMQTSRGVFLRWNLCGVFFAHIAILEGLFDTNKSLFFLKPFLLKA